MIQINVEFGWERHRKTLKGDMVVYHFFTCVSLFHSSTLPLFLILLLLLLLLNIYKL
jgi:hypothetical protein